MVRCWQTVAGAGAVGVVGRVNGFIAVLPMAVELVAGTAVDSTLPAVSPLVLELVSVNCL